MPNYKRIDENPSAQVSDRLDSALRTYDDSFLRAADSIDDDALLNAKLPYEHVHEPIDSTIIDELNEPPEFEYEEPWYESLILDAATHPVSTIADFMWNPLSFIKKLPIQVAGYYGIPALADYLPEPIPTIVNATIQPFRTISDAFLPQITPKGLDWSKTLAGNNNNYFHYLLNKYLAPRAKAMAENPEEYND